MAYSPFARFRNFTLENLKSILEVYPDMRRSLSWNEAKDEIEEKFKGYKKTAYQQACQFGIEDRSSDEFRIQNYLYNFSDENLLKYIEFWLMTYYSPNPYVNSNEKPILIFCELAKEIISSNSNEVDFYEFFSKWIGGGSDDILLNALKSFANPIQYRKDGDIHIFYIDKNDINYLREKVDFIEEEFSIPIEFKDRAIFFDRYSYHNFCKFHQIPIYNKVNDNSLICIDQDSFYSIDQLAEELKKYYDSADKHMKVASIHMFGLTFAEILLKEKINISDLIKRSQLNASYATELNKGINLYHCIKSGKYDIKYANVLKENKINNRIKGGNNIIFYGIPGCGKSYHIQHNILEKNKVKEENIFRTTFYLDYMNSDFIGQILPKCEDKKVEYVPIPGPFTKALKRAFETNEMVYLIVEEINRGNAAAIFGDIFQLLDRRKRDENGYKQGDSEYPISNTFIEDYLIEYCKLSEIKRGCIYIPSNLTILATMNTSDQNVFPLDTAFTRRWKKKRVVTNVRDTDIGKKYVPGTNILWMDFVESINRNIISSNDSINAEDKQLGAYFVDGSLLSDKAVGNVDIYEKIEDFCNKVLHYIWEDISKFEREEWFNELSDELPKSYEELLNYILKDDHDIISVFRKDKFFLNKGK